MRNAEVNEDMRMTRRWRERKCDASPVIGTFTRLADSRAWTLRTRQRAIVFGRSIEGGGKDPDDMMSVRHRR